MPFRHPTTPTRLAAAATFLLAVAAPHATGQSTLRQPSLGYLFPAGGQQGTTVRVLAGGQVLDDIGDVLVTGQGVTAKFVKKYDPRRRRLEGEEKKAFTDWLEQERRRLKGETAAGQEKGKGKRKDGGRRDGRDRDDPLPPGRQPTSTPAVPGAPPATNRPPATPAPSFPPRPTPSPKPTFTPRPTPTPTGPNPTPTPTPTPNPTPTTTGTAATTPSPSPGQPPGPPKLPDHPLLEDLSHLDLRQVQWLSDVFIKYNPKTQPNAQLEELVLLEVTIAPDAPPGRREIRLGTREGYTNPLVFEVGQAPEMAEREPNDPGAGRDLPPEPPLVPPRVINGQILPGDVDRFQFAAKRNQSLVVEVKARQLIPYLADAVPGWFQAVLALYDPAGAEVAFVDDFRFQPDPLLHYQVPADGVYTLEIRDSIYRGREDFVYRIELGDKPVITAMFPLGGRAGTRAATAVAGWNIPATLMPLDTGPAADPVRQTALRAGRWVTDPVPYAVDTLPETAEVARPNDTAATAQPLTLPTVVNGRIDKPGDLDCFAFTGRGGDTIVAEIEARRLSSPLDSIVKLLAPDGKCVAWNDDYMEKDGNLHRGAGLMTHHADSYLRAALPQDGKYVVQVADAQSAGGDAYGYRLRVCPPQPDFALRVVPSCINIRPGGIVPITVFALRQDGFAGEIQLVLEGAPEGVNLVGGGIPAGQDRVRMTVEAVTVKPSAAPAGAIPLTLVGQATIAGQPVAHPAAAADDRMQAFLWRHLLPAEQFLLAYAPKGRGPRKMPLAFATPLPLRLPRSGTASLHATIADVPPDAAVELTLDDPPPGIAIEKVAPDGKGFEIVLKTAGGDAAAKIAGGNLIFAGSRETIAKERPGKPKPKPQRQALGLTSAIPFVIAD